MMIDTSTQTAARSKISWLPERRPSTSSEKLMVATPLGPNQAMNALAEPESPVPTSEAVIPIGLATRNVVTTITSGAQPQLKIELSEIVAPKTTNTTRSRQDPPRGR